MPLVRIDIMEGRPPAMIRELHERVAALVAEVLDTPIERVRTYITEFPPQAWGIGGVPADVARAAEVEARRVAGQARTEPAAIEQARTEQARTEQDPTRQTWTELGGAGS